MYLVLLATIPMCFNVFSAEATCGRSIGGQVTIHRGWQVRDQRKWPWMISLQWRNSSKHFCSGTLINSGWILTAAHCVKDIKTEEVKLVLGGLNLTANETSQFTRNISEVLIHPDYKYNSTDPLYIVNDVALIRINGEVSYSSHVHPACLPDADDHAYRDCHAVGWGRVNSWEPEGGPLKEAWVRTFPASSCAHAHPRMASMIRHGNFICAMGFLGGRICQGDSGGPLLCRIGHKSTWSVVGVASWTTGECSYSERPFGFAETKHFVRWIKLHVLQGNLTVPELNGSFFGPVLALSGGEALLANTPLWHPAKVVKLNERGLVVPPVFTCRTRDIIKGIMMDGDRVYILQYSGLISRVRIPSLNQTEAEWQMPGVSYPHPGALVGNELYLVDYFYNNVFSFNLVTQRKQIRKSGLNKPFYLTTTTLHSSTRRLFIIAQKRGHSVVMYNESWDLVTTIESQLVEGNNNNVLVTPWSTLLVAEWANHRVSEFNLSGTFVRYLLTERDGLYFPLHISYSRPYLWVVHLTRGGGPFTVRRYHIVP